MLTDFRRNIYFEGDAGGTGGTGAAGNADQNKSNNDPGAGKSSYGTFEEFITKQPEDVRKLYESHTTGLRNTIQATREERDNLSKQIKDLLPKAEKGSELANQLTNLQKQLETSDRRANFAEEAIKPEIGCSNIKAAFALAVAEDLFDKHGLPSWDAIKKTAPELFKKSNIPDGNGGEGGEGGVETKNMDGFIRKRAGVAAK